MLRASNKRDLNKNDGVVVVIVVIVVIVSSCQYKVQAWCFKFFILSVVALCCKCLYLSNHMHAGHVCIVSYSSVSAHILCQVQVGSSLCCCVALNIVSLCCAAYCVCQVHTQEACVSLCH